MIEKWTVRNLPERALEQLWEVRENTPGATLGELLGMAVEQWYRELPEGSVAELE